MRPSWPRTGWRASAPSTRSGNPSLRGSDDGVDRSGPQRRAARAPRGRAGDLQAVSRRILARPRRQARVPGEVRHRAHRGGLSRRADPTGVRRRGTRHPRGRPYPRIDQLLRRQRRGLPRPDVHHGHRPPARLRGAEAEYLPKIATGVLRLQAFGVTEPNSGSDTTKLQTTAIRAGDRYVVNGQKIFISRVLQSDLMLLLARTTPVDRVKRKTDGLSVFLIDIRDLKGFEVRPLRMMMNHSTNALFFDNVEIPVGSLIGEEGRGFHYILDGMNAERNLIASDSLGDARWFIDKAVAYSNQRVIFGRPIGANQGVQFAIARAHISTDAAQLMRDKAAALFDNGQP